ncbi:hypothetical protein C0J52_27970 [Blattella germanica]|nr:hypothetical protein C0J52_27970 [Blattella germanica]
MYKVSRLFRDKVTAGAWEFQSNESMLGKSCGLLGLQQMFCDTVVEKLSGSV